MSFKFYYSTSSSAVRSESENRYTATDILSTNWTRPTDVPESSESRHTLSTGHEVTVPLETDAEATGLVVTADAERADEWVPDGLAPLRVAPGRAAVTLLSVDYRRIGDDAMDPYEEVCVAVAVAPATDSPVSRVAALRDGFGGYVAALPVTTESARALGDEVWGYPKTVADIAITDRGDRRRTALGDDRGHVLTLEASARTQGRGTVETRSYADGNGLRRQANTLGGALGGRPFGGSYSLGHHPLAERLRGLDLGRPLCSSAFDGRFRIGVGHRLVA